MCLYPCTHLHTHIIHARKQEDLCAPCKSPSSGLISSLRSLLCSPQPKNGIRPLTEETLTSAGNCDEESSSGRVTDDDLNSRISGLSVECCLNGEGELTCGSIMDLHGVVDFNSTGFLLEDDDDDVSAHPKISFIDHYAIPNSCYQLLLCLQ